jgi:hypothetical protein
MRAVRRPMLAFAVLGAVQAVLRQVLDAAQRSALEAARPHAGDFDEASRALWDRVNAIGRVDQWLGLAVMVLEIVLVGTMLAKHRGARHGWLQVALVGTAVALFTEVAVALLTGESDVDLHTLNLVAVTGALFYRVGTAALVGACVAHLPRERERAYTIGYGVLAALVVARMVITVATIDPETHRSAFQLPTWLSITHSVLLSVLLVVALVDGARTRTPEPEAPPRAFTGAPIRTIAWVGATRIVLAIASGGLAMLAVQSGEGIAPLLGVVTLVGLVLGLVQLAAMAQQLRWPADAHDGAQLGGALALATLVVLMEPWLAWRSTELLDLVTSMQHATSLWSMPSISRIEELQATVLWGGRVAQAFGAAAWVLLLGSFARTAAHLAETEVQGRLESMRRMAGGVAAAALLLGAAATSGPSVLAVPLLLGLVVTLGLALYVTGTTWSALLALAAALDRPALAPVANDDDDDDDTDDE